jgi:uncharacterized membrane protein YeaQ/YmgE (transglycosylase-associated protein family)
VRAGGQHRARPTAQESVKLAFCDRFHDIGRLGFRHEATALARSTLRKEILMHIIWTILIGFVAGLIARTLTPGNQTMGFFLTAAIGIAGSLIATYVGAALHWYSPGQGAGFFASVVGAIALLVIYGLVARKG